MIAIDTNLLVYAFMAQSPWNELAYRLIGDLVATRTQCAIPMHCLNEFFAIVTHPRIYKPPTPTRDALAQVDAWLGSDAIAILGEDVETWTVQRDLVLAAKLAGPAIHDARVAAVCIHHGVAELWTSDRDFSRFPALRTRNPLLGPLPTRTGERPTRYRVERRGRPARRSSANV
jgi:uncharacterized protein